MHIVLFCATRRGLLVLRRLHEVVPDCKLTVFSFPEEPWEPPFLENIRNLAREIGGNFIEARRADSKSLSDFWARTSVDQILAVSWRYLIPESIYRLAKRGAYVFHDSLLPEYRGFSPTVWAMINGEDHTGVTLFQIAEHVDSGDIVDQARVAIGIEDDISIVVERVTQSYLSLLENNIHGLLSGDISLRAQQHELATFTCKRLPDDNRVDWSKPSLQIYNLIRAVTRPYSGAFTELNGRRLRIWRAVLVPNERAYVGRVPGRVVEIRPDQSVLVLTGDGCLLIHTVGIEEQEVAPAAQILTSLNYTLGR